MSDHLNTSLLQKYGGHKLNAAELISVIQHLESCESCYRAFEKMFPQIKTTAAKFNYAILSKDEPFHLEYEEHLQPYIDETAADVDREIIESHLEICSACLQQVRELREFKHSLELKALKEELAKRERETIWTKFQTWIWSHKIILAFGSSLIVFGLLGLLFSYFSNSKSNQIEEVKKQIPQIPAANLSTPEKINVNIENNRNINSNQSPQPVNSSPMRTPEMKPEEPELANLVLPAYLKDLQNHKNGLRSNDNKLAEKITIISPNGKVIRQSSPVLNWTNVEGIQDYEVSLYDENLNQIDKQTVTGNSWEVSLSLTRGRLFYWQVKAKSADKNYLGQSKFYLISQADENKINQAKDSLQRGKVLAEAGLLDEAKIELNKYLKQNPDSKITKVWLKQIE